MQGKSIFKSKTFYTNILLGIVAVSASPYVGLLPSTAMPYVTAAGAVANIALRLITSQPIVSGTSDPAAK